MLLRLRPSPNFGDRRAGFSRPQFVVLHYTAMANADAAVRWLCDPVSEVSAHYVICKTGAVYGLVAETKRAWHAGAGCWGGITDMNSASIGIELDNDGATPFTPPLMRALTALLGGILARWQIPPRNVIGHSDFAPGRKIDPGPLFDWARLAGAGLADPQRARTVTA